MDPPVFLLSPFPYRPRDSISEQEVTAFGGPEPVFRPVLGVCTGVWGCVRGGLRGATIVDSLDSLYIMGLTEDYKEAKEWIRTSLDLDLSTAIDSNSARIDCFLQRVFDQQDSFQIKHSPKVCLVQLLTALLLFLGFSGKREGARLEKDIARVQTNPIIMDAETGRWREN
ncbi:hypothetical protein QTP70_006043 [Hemibagrus guttatus]|uniref:Alpha-1,2-Mannosidase n=1 Tax=Hemibagrus guttatus TaxID=175788 RepID=A0AAE0Q745_9TELE|nr:hypothetical protein QTP70_006043 [Hemibagrus guttatus]KAK3540912.1 hypothetical protein QTP86_004174 [Hemibagrus guttatus]